MMNRRRFLQTLGIAALGVYLRLAPERVLEVRQIADPKWTALNDYFASAARAFHEPILRWIMATDPYAQLSGCTPLPPNAGGSPQ